ncbi:hypothetical protein CAPTEDRAFT_203333 [Capitella teleta]|uniref:EB domain-containing protein n=1 Tax=Capitella teleta TaxID=283909 RepID=R7VA32_CAPTE|nr:hypothetical protein CAPTEDRAFT_203333 [Capitella teleta]|eukprot:ELU15392.1 hypothetical protein CAPTEDRAFT_203333 [Capitella teleta]
MEFVLTVTLVAIFGTPCSAPDVMSYRPRQNTCVRHSDCGYDSTCLRLKGCPRGICIQFSRDEIIRPEDLPQTVFISGKQCDRYKECDDFMLCQSTGVCLSKQVRLLGQRCSPNYGDVCVQATVRINERGCSNHHQCQQGAMCFQNRCRCPPDYKPYRDFCKPIWKPAVMDLSLGQHCDEMQEKRYCAPEFVCHRCPGEKQATCVVPLHDVVIPETEVYSRGSETHSRFLYVIILLVIGGFKTNSHVVWLNEQVSEDSESLGSVGK